MSDILLNSVYNQYQIDVERDVIFREMLEVEQNMQEVVFDHLHNGAFNGCSLAYTILGPINNIKFKFIYYKLKKKKQHCIKFVCFFFF